MTMIVAVHKKLMTLIYVSTCRDVFMKTIKTSKIKIFAKKVKCNKPLTILAKSSTPDVYTSDLCI